MTAVMDNEVRLDALRSSGLLTKSVAERVDHLAFAACRLLLADAAKINALDGTLQHTVAGWPPGDYPDQMIAATGCREPVRTGSPFAVEDALLHPVTCDLPWAQAFRGYLGAPLLYGSGEAIGAVCVLSVEPRRWKAYEIDALVGVARLVVMSLD